MFRELSLLVKEQGVKCMFPSPLLAFLLLQPTRHLLLLLLAMTGQSLDVIEASLSEAKYTAAAARDQLLEGDHYHQGMFTTSYSAEDKKKQETKYGVSSGISPISTHTHTHTHTHIIYLSITLFSLCSTVKGERCSAEQGARVAEAGGEDVLLSTTGAAGICLVGEYPRSLDSSIVVVVVVASFIFLILDPPRKSDVCAAEAPHGTVAVPLSRSDDAKQQADCHHKRREGGHAGVALFGQGQFRAGKPQGCGGFACVLAVV